MNKRGFTIIEVLFVIALVVVLLAAVYPYLGAFHTSWQDTQRRGDIIQNARIGMDKMVKEFRQAGGFTSIEESLVTFTDVDDSSITYRLNAGNLERNSVILAGPVDSLVFTYFDEEGEEKTTASLIKSVEISMTVSDSEEGANPLSFVSMAFARSTIIRYLFSKNSDFSTSDATFSTTDTFYIRVSLSQDQVDYTNLDYATCQLKKGGTRVNFDLNNNADGTYTGSQSLSGFATGIWQVNIDIKDNAAGRYRPTPAPTITIQ